MKTFLIALALMTGSVSISSAWASSDNFVNQLLGIQSPEYSYDDKGTNQFDELAAYKATERDYIAARDKVSGDSIKRDDLAYFLFIGFAAKNANAASTMEAMNNDVMPVFKRDSQAFLSLLKSRPFLLESSCYYLGRYFGFEDKNAGDLKAFLKQYRDEFKKTLGKKACKQCWKMMKSVAK